MEVRDDFWVVSVMHYDLRYIDLEQLQEKTGYKRNHVFVASAKIRWSSKDDPINNESTRTCSPIYSNGNGPRLWRGP